MMMKKIMPTSGLLLVDKPQGVTSHDVVAYARHLLHTKRVGHAGTLDPMATGLLIVGFGHATRLLNYMLGHQKTYEAVIRLGEATTTDDAEGEILPEYALQAGPGIAMSNRDDLMDSLLNTSMATIEKDALLQQAFQRMKQIVSKNLTGRIMQTPTAFSAIKINGQRAYDLAREGKTVNLESREITVHEFTISNPQLTRGVSGRLVCDITATVSCSSGTYIRALARDLGRLMGVGGHLTQLRRTSISDFSINDARVMKLNVETREFTDRNGILQQRAKVVSPPHFDADNMLPQFCFNMLETAEHTLPMVLIDAVQAQDLRFGRWISLPSIDNTLQYPAIAYSLVEDTAQYDVVAVVEPAKNSKSNQIKPIVIFPVSEKTGKLE